MLVLKEALVNQGRNNEGVPHLFSILVCTDSINVAIFDEFVKFSKKFTQCFTRLLSPGGKWHANVSFHGFTKSRVSISIAAS